ncbi:MAG: tRNA 2-thiocytidine biosynthesis TtcA family protein [Spirochaetes bacterium]|nr:tRNA 2-thiocytidine biosynthesis TtcA family protein [Spirochaetota bacterium]
MSKTIEQIIDGLVVKALKTWNMVQRGERILIGASGGKDSAILAYDLAKKKRQGRLNAELLALHVRNDFAPHALSPRLRSLYDQWGIPLATIDVAVEGRLKPGRQMNCYWCSTQRRTELIRYALEHEFTAVALGHHLDDVLETLFMNMMDKAQLSTMPPLLHYNKYPLKIIRPLYLVEEDQLLQFGRQLGLVSADGPYKLSKNSQIDQVDPVRPAAAASVPVGGEVESVDEVQPRGLDGAAGRAGAFSSVDQVPPGRLDMAAGGPEQKPDPGLFTTCTCGFNDNSARDRVRERVEALTGGSSVAKRAILESLRNIKTEYLP